MRMRSFSSALTASRKLSSAEVSVAAFEAEAASPAR
jgi:hypothetical protein